MDLALQEAEREAAASYQAARAVWEAVCGNAAEAKRNAMAALALSNGRDVEYAAALALALSGDSSRSQPLADDLEKRFPEDTFAKFTYVPVLRALSALERGKPTDSVERLQIALPYELAVNGLNFNHFYLGGLHSAYVRGEALLAAHRYAEAAAEFQKILDHRGHRGRGSHRRTGALATGQSVRFVGRQDQGEGCLPGFPRTLERRRPRYPDPEKCQSRVRAAAAANSIDWCNLSAPDSLCLLWSAVELNHDRRAGNTAVDRRCLRWRGHPIFRPHGGRWWSPPPIRNGRRLAPL